MEEANINEHPNDNKSSKDVVNISNQNEEYNKDEFIFELVKERYNKELERIRDLENKASAFIGYISIVLSLLIGAGTFDILEKSKPEQYFIYFIGIILLIISFFFCIDALRIQKWYFMPNVDHLLQEYIKPKYSKRSILSKMLGTMPIAINDINKKNNTKANRIKWSWFFLIAGLLVEVIFVLVLLLS